jgi:NFU1 iron-sulfur cluster scaffold homolog, mitochondrial
MNLTERVEAAFGRGILSSVIARGATVRVAAVEDGVATLEVAGSPGAVYPLAARMEALIRAAVPEVTALRLVPPGHGPAGVPGEDQTEDLAGDLAEAARRVLDTEINPAIAAHRGHVSVSGGEDGWIRARLEGGCQGCSLAEVTLRQGIEPVLRARLPGMTGLVDVTDHEAGAEPFFSPEKR